MVILMTEAQEWVKVFVPLAVGLAWPVLVGIIVFGFRTPLRDLIGRIRVIKSAVGTAEFAASVDEAKGEPGDDNAPGEPTPAPPTPDINPPSLETRGGASATDTARRGAAAYEGRRELPSQMNAQLQREWKLSFPNSRSLIDRANDNPVYAILTGYTELERWLDQAIKERYLVPNFRHSVTKLARFAAQYKVISEESVTRIEALSNARAIAAHQPEEITKFMALDFLYTLDDLFRDLEKEVNRPLADEGPSQQG